MFGPNCQTRIEQDIDGHHRETAFSHLLERLDKAFRCACGVGGDLDLLFLTGSGTLGVEAAVSSLLAPARPPNVRGVFTARLRNTMQAYNALDENAERHCEVALETSHSDVRHEPGAFLLDAVSSFPYYPIPPETPVWVTVSSKQLGAVPVLAVVAVQKDAWENLCGPDRPSYLNLARYRQARMSGQTPNTPAIPLLADFAKRLEAFDVEAMRRRIDANSDRVVRAIGREHVIGERRCPVITVPKSGIPPAVAAKFQLYGLNTDSPNYQVFTYSEADERYALLVEALS